MKRLPLLTDGPQIETDEALRRLLEIDQERGTGKKATSRSVKVKQSATATV
jgi:hypothetical protein